MDHRNNDGARKEEWKGGTIAMNNASRTVMEHKSNSMAEIEATEKTVATGSGAEAIAGAAALVLAIIGLAGMMSTVMSAISVIAAGAAFLFQGAAVAARHSYLGRMARADYTEGELMTDTSAEIIGGITGIVLGILALIGLVPMTLLSVGTIVFGGTLLLGSRAVYGVGSAEPKGRTTADYVAREIVARAGGGQPTWVAEAAGAQALIGIGSVTLGILALIGMATQTLVLVAVLAVGVSALLSGGALTAKMVNLLYQ